MAWALRIEGVFVAPSEKTGLKAFIHFQVVNLKAKAKHFFKIARRGGETHQIISRYGMQGGQGMGMDGVGIHGIHGILSGAQTYTASTEESGFKRLAGRRLQG
jgi:hypothetical protein